MITRAEFEALREAADDESLSYGDLVTIEGAFAEVPDEQLRDVRENAMADDMLDEIATFLGYDGAP